jgi:hypothetical protein
MLNMTRIIAQAYVDGSLVAIPCGGSGSLGSVTISDVDVFVAEFASRLFDSKREDPDRVLVGRATTELLNMLDDLAAPREETK